MKTKKENKQQSVCEKNFKVKRGIVKQAEKEKLKLSSKMAQPRRSQRLEFSAFVAKRKGSDILFELPPPTLAIVFNFLTVQSILVLSQMSWTWLIQLAFRSSDVLDPKYLEVCAHDICRNWSHLENLVDFFKLPPSRNFSSLQKIHTDNPLFKHLGRFDAPVSQTYLPWLMMRCILNCAPIQDFPKPSLTVATRSCNFNAERMNSDHTSHWFLHNCNKKNCQIKRDREEIMVSVGEKIDSVIFGTLFQHFLQTKRAQTESIMDSVSELEQFEKTAGSTNLKACEDLFYFYGYFNLSNSEDSDSYGDDYSDSLSSMYGVRHYDMDMFWSDNGYGVPFSDEDSEADEEIEDSDSW